MFGFKRRQKTDRRERMIVQVATASHEQWRNQWRASHGDEPRLKPTHDRVWTKTNKTNVVDIAALAYPDLPSDWQAESRASAEVAVDLVLTAGRHDEAFVEWASDIIHDQWIKRNHAHASEELLRPYAELSDEEKEKDRFHVRAAITALGH